MFKYDTLLYSKIGAIAMLLGLFWQIIIILTTSVESASVILVFQKLLITQIIGVITYGYLVGRRELTLSLIQILTTISLAYLIYNFEQILNQI